MPQLTIAELEQIIYDCAGAEEDVKLTDATADHLFSDLGYDSVSVMETVNRIERDYQVRLPEEACASRTPGALLSIVNEALDAR